MKKDIKKILNILGDTFASSVADVISGKHIESEFEFTIIIETKTSNNTGILIGEKKITKNMTRFKADKLLSIIEETINRL